jgi:hypothetical protein
MNLTVVIKGRQFYDHLSDYQRHKDCAPYGWLGDRLIDWFYLIKENVTTVFM